MLVFLLVLLLIAAIAGVLGAVLKAALVIVLAVILAFLILVAGTYWYVRFKMTKFLKEVDRRHRGYPARGHSGPPDEPRPPQLPPD